MSRNLRKKTSPYGQSRSARAPKTSPYGHLAPLVPQSLTAEVLINRNKEELGRSALSFVTYLFNTVQKLKSPTSDIVKDLGSFDMETLLTGRTEHAMYCFSQLFSSFRLRSYFEIEQESPCSEEYRSFIDELRQSYPELVQTTLVVKDTVKFLGEQSALKSCPLLLKIFRFSCLCLDEPFEALAGITFGSVIADNPTSSHNDAVLPVQSYFHNVLYGMESVTTDQSVSSFLQLEPTFGYLLSMTKCRLFRTRSDF